MKTTQINPGRTFAATFEHGKDFFEELGNFCKNNNIRSAYIPMFLGALTDIVAVGTFGKVASPEKPMLATEHRIFLENADVTGCGTIAFDEKTGEILPHIHINAGPRTSAGMAHTTHLFSATVQFTVEIIIVEVESPTLIRTKSDLFGLGLLDFV
ncbi:MAG: DUF296 domain-containing protein [Oscillospiraceae bacterium]|nr:DUF296 domain-containing protein [Oscillospiraceae bacterium]